jgi:hypothetical protein
MSVLNDSTFNPATGTQSTTADFIAGPLNPLSANIISYKCTSFSVSFLPIVSDLNNSGEIYMTYFPKAPNTTAEAGD